MQSWNAIRFQYFTFLAFHYFKCRQKSFLLSVSFWEFVVLQLCCIKLIKSGCMYSLEKKIHFFSSRTCEQLRWLQEGIKQKKKLLNSQRNFWRIRPRGASMYVYDFPRILHVIVPNQLLFIEKLNFPLKKNFLHLSDEFKKCRKFCPYGKVLFFEQINAFR